MSFASGVVGEFVRKFGMRRRPRFIDLPVGDEKYFRPPLSRAVIDNVREQVRGVKGYFPWDWNCVWTSGNEPESIKMEVNQ